MFPKNLSPGPRWGFFLALLISWRALAAEPVLIEMHGDSITVGYTGSGSNYRISAVNEPADLSVWLYERYSAIPGARVPTVVNLGIGGTTCQNRMNGDPTRSILNIWQTMAASKAGVVSFSYGVNDALTYSADYFKFCLATLIRVAQGYGKVVVVETPLGLSEAVAGLAADAADVADENGAHLVNHAALIDGRLPDWHKHLPDGVHPDDTLYLAKAAIAYTVLNPLVQDRQ